MGLFDKPKHKYEKITKEELAEELGLLDVTEEDIKFLKGIKDNIGFDIISKMPSFAFQKDIESTQLKVLNAIMNQNYIMINELKRLNKNLEKQGTK